MSGDPPESPGSAGPGSAGQGSSGQGSSGQGSADGGAWEVPWAEPFAADGEQQERARLAAEFGAAIRRTSSLMQLMGQAAADKIGLNATDLNCLNILSFSGQMTAGQLATATGLTTASITGVADRLEEAGYVRRERDPADRRRVVIRLILERSISDVGAVFLPMVRAWQLAAARYTDDELRLIVDFYGQMEEILRQHIALLRGSGEPGPSPAQSQPQPPR